MKAENTRLWGENPAIVDTLTDREKIEGLVPLHIWPITASVSRHAHGLDEVWGMANEVIKRELDCMSNAHNDESGKPQPCMVLEL